MTDQPRLSLPSHTWRKTAEGLLVEDPFRLVVPRPGSGAVHCVTYTRDGVRIAWDTCGVCLLHVSICRHDMPTEPAYITRMRTGEEGPQSYLGTAVRSADPSPLRTQFSGKGGAPGIAISDLVTADVVAQVKAAKEARDD